LLLKRFARDEAEAPALVAPLFLREDACIA
jgi:hypothetical protein